MAAFAAGLLGDEGRMRSFREAARVRAAEFDRKDVVRLYEDYYEEVLSA